jgi:hypothetical protein
MPVLTVRRDNNKAIILVETDLPFKCDGSSTTSLPFEWRMTRPYSAELLARYLEKRIYDAIVKARQESYEQGWKDAKAKNPKKHENWFSGIL